MTATSVPAVRTGRTRWILSVFAIVALLPTLIVSPQKLPHISFCWFHSATGLPCPGCGLTRSVFAIGSGEFAAAWAFNPFGYLVYGILIVFLFLPLLARVAPRLTGVLESSRFLNTLVAVSVLSLLIYGFARIALSQG